MTFVKRPRHTAALAALAVSAGLTMASSGSSAAPAGPGAVAALPGAARADAPHHYRYLPAEVFTSSGLGSVAVGMPNRRTVKIQRLDPATGAWSRPALLYRERGVTCGEIEGRASAGGVALLLECDRPYYEDQPPTHSVGLVSRDLHGWAMRRLPGESHRAPAISPDGAYAAWLTGGHGRYLMWSAAAGFAPPAATTYGHDSGGETLVVDDAGTVAVLGPEPLGNRCVVGVHERSRDGVLAHAVVEGVDPGCSEGSLANADALTVTGGADRAHRFTIARAGAGGPWQLTRIRPSEAPGLVRYGHSRTRIPTTFLETVDPARPLVAVGSPDRRRLLAQVYDDQDQAWRPPTLLHTARGGQCREGGHYFEELRALYVYELECGRRATVLASADGQSWTLARIGRRPWVFVGERLALPDDGGTSVLSPAGLERFPGTAEGHCGLVWPGRPGELVRLRAAPGATWPDRVQVSTGGRFRTVSHARDIDAPCHRAFVDTSVDPPVVLLRPKGGGSDRVAQLRLRHGKWRLVYGPRVY